MCSCICGCFMVCCSFEQLWAKLLETQLDLKTADGLETHVPHCEFGMCIFYILGKVPFYMTKKCSVTYG